MRRAAVLVGIGAVLAAGGCTDDTGGTVGPDASATTIGANLPAGSTLLTATLAGPPGGRGTARVRVDPPLAQVCADLTVTGSAGSGPAQIVTDTGAPAVALPSPPADGKPSSACVIVVQNLFDQVKPGAVVRVGELTGTLG